MTTDLIMRVNVRTTTAKTTIIVPGNHTVLLWFFFGVAQLPSFLPFLLLSSSFRPFFVSFLALLASPFYFHFFVLRLSRISGVSLVLL